MLKFFRKIRYNLIESGKSTRYFKYAIGEIILVVIGILIALQINNWNAYRKERLQEELILRNLQKDFQADIIEIRYQLAYKEKMIQEYHNCLDILSEKRKGTKAELLENLGSILQVGGVSLNKTTFNNLESTGEIRLIQNKTLADSITSYYNNGYKGWESALRDYTRNITAPYFLSFDYLPQLKFRDNDNKVRMMTGKPLDFKKPERDLEDYKQDYFIINTLRQKTYNLEALADKYKGLLNYAESLDLNIQNYLNKK